MTRESVLTFGPEGKLVGILTEPTERGADSDVAMVVLNAGIVHRVGPNRLHVRMARTVAREGLTVLRFDLAGIGDSEELGTAESVDEQCLTSIAAALDMLEARGISRFVLFGVCSGAEYAFRHAVRDDRVSAIAGADPPTMERSAKSYLVQAASVLVRPVVWYHMVTGRYGLMRRLRALRGPREATSRRRAALRRWIRAGLVTLVSRPARLLLIVTGTGGRRYNYPTQLFDLFPGAGLERVVTVTLLPKASHTFQGEADRRELLRELLAWLGEIGALEPGPIGSHREGDMPR
jgi:alpha/beta superfamily hydrolase